MRKLFIMQDVKEKNRFASASRRDNQKCKVFKMATWMVIIKSSVFDV